MFDLSPYPTYTDTAPVVGSIISRIYHFAEYLGFDIGNTRADRYTTFRHILTEYDNMISRLCLGYARSGEDFEDLRQDVYTNIWQGLDGFRGEADIKTWIYRVTLNTCVSSVRRRTKSGVKISFDDFTDIMDDGAEKAELLAELHDAISELPSVDKAIILMWLDEMNYDDIAEVTGLKRNTLAVRLHRAKEKLKRVFNNDL